MKTYILIIETEDFPQARLNTWLKNEGYQTVLVNNRLDAVQPIIEQMGLPELIICCLGAQSASECECCLMQSRRAEFIEVPLILLSASLNPAKVGFNLKRIVEILNLPIDARELLGLVELYCG